MMSNLKQKLSKLSTGEKSRWKENAKFRRDNRDWLSKSAAIAVKILNTLKMQGISQKLLAERMGVSPQQVSKIVKGQENLTLETITKLETILGIDIIDSSLKNKSAA
jgi:ribosome-binding protein aMBF1 (putative translation factor)